MAGIGFELRRMIDQREGFVAKVRAYACAGLISSGPWVMTILTLTLLNLAGPYVSGDSDYSMFRALVTYAFAFSLVLQGFGQMAITRRVADLLYSHQYERVLPAFTASLVGLGVVQVAIGTAFCWVAGFPPALATVAVALFAIIGMTWISLIWLSVAREYDEVLRAYIYGTLVALLGMLVFSWREGSVGVLAAYTAGQSFTLFLLIRVILRGMESNGPRDYTIWTSVREFPRLVGVGLFYNAAIWVDKMIFWFRDGVGPHPMVRYHPLYDTCSFLAYMTVVPALAVNLVRLETSFYEKYRAYYGAILGGTPLSVIADRRTRMFENMQESTVRLLRVQGAITVAVIIFAPFIIDFLEMPPISVRIFRLTCLGAFFHVLLLITILMQMYFDLRAQALATSFAFLLLNGGLAWWSVSFGVETYGVGYATAGFLSLLLGYLLLHHSLERIDYLTFTGQPIGGDREDEVEGEVEGEAAKEETRATESKPADATTAAGTIPPQEEEEEEDDYFSVGEQGPPEPPRAPDPESAPEVEPIPDMEPVYGEEPRPEPTPEPEPEDEPPLIQRRGNKIVIYPRHVDPREEDGTVLADADTDTDPDLPRTPRDPDDTATE